MTDKDNTKKHMSSFSSSPLSSSSWWWPWRWFDGRRVEEEEEVEGTNDDYYAYKQPQSVTIAENQKMSVFVNCIIDRCFY